MKKKSHLGCSCQQKSIGKMKRRRISGASTKGLMNVLTNQILPVGAGYYLGNMLVDKFGDKLPVPGRYLKIGLGLFGALKGKGMVQAAAVGVAAAGVVELASDAISGPGVGLYPPGTPMYRIAGSETDELNDPVTEPVYANTL